MRESELFAPVRDYLAACGYEIRSELHDCDIVAVKDGELVAVELKAGFTLPLILQAAKRQRFCDRVYMAVPRSEKLPGKRLADMRYLARRLELGLIFVSLAGGRADIEIIEDPAPFDRAASVKSRASKRKRSSLMSEFAARSADYNTGGTTGVPRMTAYREKSLYIACCLELTGGTDTRRLRTLGCDVKKTTGILYRNVYGWFENTGKGAAKLSPAGEAALAGYEYITAGMRERARAAAAEEDARAAEKELAKAEKAARRKRRKKALEDQ